MFTANELTIRAEATIDGTTYVVLNDGTFTHVYRDEDVDYSVEYGDYNDFCQAVDAIDDEAIIAAVCREAGLAGAYTPGSCVWVPAAINPTDHELVGAEFDAEEDSHGVITAVDTVAGTIRVNWGYDRTVEPIGRLADWGLA